MYTGKLLVCRYNGLFNAKPNEPRNLFTKIPVSVEKPEQFKEIIHQALDTFPPGKGYVLVSYKDKYFICEKDANDPEGDYVRHEITGNHHPFLDKLIED